MLINVESILNGLTGTPLKGNEHDKFELIVADTSYENWESVSISQSLTQIAGDFEVSVSSKFPTNWAESYGIYLGAPFVVKVNGVSLVNGFIEEIPLSYSKDNYTISYSGRDKTGDLVDCCHDISTHKSEFLDQTPLAIIKKLCEPFSIDVYVDSADVHEEIFDVSKPLSNFGIDVGAPVYDAIIKLCQMYAILPYTNGDGKLHLGRTSKQRTTDNLEGGVNILSASINMSNVDRFKTYCARSSASNAEAISGDFEDQAINRHRPLLIVDGDLKTISDCKKKASWESNVRAGKSRKIDVTVQGWTQSDGSPWPLNKLVHVYDPYLGVDADQLIVGLSFSLNDTAGSITSIELADPKTFELKKKEVIKKDDFLTFAQENKLKAGINEIGSIDDLGLR